MRGGSSRAPFTLDLAFPAAVAQLCVRPMFTRKKEVVGCLLLLAVICCSCQTRKPVSSEHPKEISELIIDARVTALFCPMHALQLREDIVPVVPVNVAWLSAQESRFPFANSRCQTQPALAGFKVRVLYCPICRTNEAEYFHLNSKQ
jgi:hypothetical protein